jgi:hypothetical protein
MMLQQGDAAQEAGDGAAKQVRPAKLIGSRSVSNEGFGIADD